MSRKGEKRRWLIGDQAAQRSCRFKTVESDCGSARCLVRERATVRGPAGVNDVPRDQSVVGELAPVGRPTSCAVLVETCRAMSRIRVVTRMTAHSEWPVLLTVEEAAVLLRTTR